MNIKMKVFNKEKIATSVALPYSQSSSKLIRNLSEFNILSSLYNSRQQLLFTYVLQY